MQFTVESITSTDGFRNLKEEWNGLLLQSQSKTFTLRWEWLFTWWEVFRDATTELSILTVRDLQQGLVGIAPFYLRHRQIRSYLPVVRDLMFLGTGEAEESEVCSEYLDIFSLPGQEAPVLNVLFSYLNSPDSPIKWHRIFLKGVLVNAAGLQGIDKLISASHLPYETENETSCYRISLQNKWEDTFNRLERKQRYEIRRDTKKLYETGSVHFRCYENEPNYMEGFTILSTLHQKRWIAAGRPGVFSDTKFMAFHKQILQIAYENKWLQLPILLWEGEPIGALYNFIMEGSIFEYQTGLKQELPHGISAGIVIRSLTLQNAIQRGLQGYDFFGGNNDYKRRWASDSRKIVDLMIYSKSLPIKIFRILSRIKRSGSALMLTPLSDPSAIEKPS